MNNTNSGFSVISSDSHGMIRRGFYITFANGYTVSVQFGSFAYCETRDNGRMKVEQHKEGEKEIHSKDAEIAAWDSDNNWVSFEDDEVMGYVNPNEVLAFMQTIAKICCGTPGNEVRITVSRGDDDLGYTTFNVFAFKANTDGGN